MLPEANATQVIIPEGYRNHVFRRYCNLLDWFRRLEWAEGKGDQLVVQTVDGKKFFGQEAYCQILYRLPLLFIPVFVYYSCLLIVKKIR